MSGPVIFDLYGTLVPGGSSVLRDGVAKAMAAELGVDGEELARLVSESYQARLVGKLGGLYQTITSLALQLGSTCATAAVEKAVALRLEMCRGLLVSCWALPVLAELRDRGHSLGVVTDCSAETPTVWPSTPLAALVDATAFSCLLGTRKPDPQMYLAVSESLGVSPTECTYVGDGASNELAGARSVGMRAIWYNDLGRQQMERPELHAHWDGEEVNDLSEIVPLVS